MSKDRNEFLELQCRVVSSLPYADVDLNKAAVDRKGIAKDCINGNVVGKIDAILASRFTEPKTKEEKVKDDKAGKPRVGKNKKSN